MAAASFPDGVITPIVLKPDPLLLGAPAQYNLFSFTSVVDGSTTNNFVAPVGFYFAPTIRYTTAAFLTIAPAFFAAPTFRPLASGTDLSSLFAGFLSTPIYSPATGGGSPTTTLLAGYVGNPQANISGAGTATIAEASAFAAKNALGTSISVGTGVTITLGTGLHVGNAAGAGTITTLVGVEIDALTKGATNCSIRSAGTAEMRHLGSAVFGGAAITAGRTNASVALEVQSTTQALLLSRMTTAQRNTMAGVAIADGTLIYNTTTATVQGRVAGAWVSL